MFKFNLSRLFRHWAKKLIGGGIHECNGERDYIYIYILYNINSHINYSFYIIYIIYFIIYITLYNKYILSSTKPTRTKQISERVITTVGESQSP